MQGDNGEILAVNSGLDVVGLINSNGDYETAGINGSYQCFGECPGFTIGVKAAGTDGAAANNGPVDWVIEDYSLLRLKQNWWKWALGYGAKVGAVKLLKPAASTVGYLSGLSTLMMLGSTLLDAADPSKLPPPPPTDPCMGQFMGLNWVQNSNGVTVGVPACQ